MQCQILSSGKNKKNIVSLSSAGLAQRVVKAKQEHSIKNMATLLPQDSMNESWIEMLIYVLKIQRNIDNFSKMSASVISM